jgi:tetratricopeptide (TPR) repeat protein
MGVNARIKLAQLLRKARRYVEAADEYAQILTIDPEHIAIRREYASYLLSLAQAQLMLHVASVDQVASSLRLLNPSARLQELLRASVEKYREQVDWVLMQAQLQSLEGNNFDAQQFYRFLYSRLPNEPVVVNYYLESLLVGARQNRDSRLYEEVVRASTALLATKPDLPFILFRRAEAHKAMGQEAAMNADIDRAFEVAATASIANKEYTPFQIALSQSTEAVPPSKDGTLAARLKARVAAKPEETITALGLVHVLVAMNRGEEAVQVLSKMEPPTGDDALKAIYLKESGLARYLGKDVEGAAKAYTEYLALRKNDMEAMNNFAFLLSESLGKPQEALPHAVRAVKLLESQAEPVTYVANRATFYDTLGWVKAQNKDWEGAAADLDRSVKATPMPIALYHLAKVSVQLKKMTEASNAVDTGIKIAREMNDPVLAQLEALNKEINP